MATNNNADMSFWPYPKPYHSILIGCLSLKLQRNHNAGLDTFDYPNPNHEVNLIPIPKLLPLHRPNNVCQEHCL